MFKTFVKCYFEWLCLFNKILISMESKSYWNFSVYHRMQNYYIFHKTGNGNSNFSFQNFMVVPFFSIQQLLLFLCCNFLLNCVSSICVISEMLLLIFFYLGWIWRMPCLNIEIKMVQRMWVTTLNRKLFLNLLPTTTNHKATANNR